MNNALFGKTMENLRKRNDIRIVSNVQQAEKQIAKTNCRGWKEINEDFTMVELGKTSILWSKPTIIGMSILDLSKLLMYQFHYDVMRVKYGDRLKLLFTDTDSLCYEIQTNDLYEDFVELREHLDMSDYPVDHKCFSRDNSKVVGKFKDECNSVLITNYIGLRAKMYSLKLQNAKQKHTAKGIGHSASKDIRHEAYVRSLRDEKLTHASFDTIRSRNHVLQTETVNKVALSPFDDKRFLLQETHDTLAHGHNKIADLRRKRRDEAQHLWRIRNNVV
jgi:hypothetical protein